MSTGKHSDKIQMELVENKLTLFSSDIWWRNLIESVYTTLEVDNNDNLRTNRDGTSAKSLYTTLCDIADQLKTDDAKKRDRILQLIVGEEIGVPNLLYLLQEVASVYPVNVKVSSIFRECFNPRNGEWKPKSIKSLVEREYLAGFLTAIAELQIERKKCSKKEAKETLLQTNVNMFWAFLAVIQKDPKFGSRLVSLDKVRFLHKFIRDSVAALHQRLESHLPYLKILRVMSKSSSISKILSRDGVMATVKKILDSYNGPPTTIRCQIMLDILVVLTKTSKLNCKRFLKAGLLIVIMRIFGFWNMMKGRALMKLTKAVLNIYGNLAGTVMGRRALLNTDSLVSVRKFAENCPNDKILDDIIFKACGVISQAYSRHKLPVKDKCPTKFDIPHNPEGFNPAVLVTGFGSSSEDSDAEKKKDEENDDDASDKDSDVELEDALGTSDIDSDDSSGDLEQPLLKDKSSDLSIGSREERKKQVPRFKVEGTPKFKSSISTTVTEKLSKKSVNGLISQESIDLFESVTRTIQTPLIKLVDFEHFFKELDEVGNPEEVFYTVSPAPEHITKSQSIVLGLLSGNLNCEVSGPIPSIEQKYAWKNERKEYGEVPEMRKNYLVAAKKVQSLIPFVKIAYPDFTFSYHRRPVEQVIQSSDRYTLRNKAINVMARAAGSIVFKPKVIYDLDALVSSLEVPEKGDSGTKKGNSAKVMKKPPKKYRFGNNDEKECGNLDTKLDHLKFESRFEGGNLRKVIQVGEKEYDLYLTPDVNSSSNTQWFYFQVSNVAANVPYIFNIVNCVKASSQFNFGMQPVVFSGKYLKILPLNIFRDNNVVKSTKSLIIEMNFTVASAMEGKPGWVRSGINICYFKNGYHQNTRKKTFNTVSFSLVFQKNGDICYVAYHYPYPYTRLLVELWKMLKLAKEKRRVCARYDVLCESLNKNEVPLITVTGPNSRQHPIELREIIVLTSRVHPGEPNASWMMHGILHRLLLGKNIEHILNQYIFKIVPMLNVEGVINGCSRSGLTGEDLNRVWKYPNPTLHPSIYNAKGMIEYCIRLRNKIPVLYCDLHGHSRKKNSFVYGCSKAMSWSSVDKNKEENPSIFLTLPEAMAKRTPTFVMAYCNYDIKKGRESTARVALWRDFGIQRSYTLESSYCGCDRGVYKGHSMGINQLIECGESLVMACEDLLHPVKSASDYDIITSENSSSLNLINFDESLHLSVKILQKKKRSIRKVHRSSKTKPKTRKIISNRNFVSHSV